MGWLPDDLLDAATFGGLVGAAVGVLIVAALDLVIDGSYDSADNDSAGNSGRAFGSADQRLASVHTVQEIPTHARRDWRAPFSHCWCCTRMGISCFRRLVKARATCCVLDRCRFDIAEAASGDKWFVVRAITAVGALLGLGTYFWWQFGRPGRPSFRIRWSGAGSALDAIVETTPKLVSFTRGLLWTMLAFIVWQIASWWWTNFGVPGSISHVLGYMIYGGAGVALWKGLVELRTALKGKPTLQNEGVHGGARDATPDEANRAARGGGQSSIDDRRFRA